MQRIFIFACPPLLFEYLQHIRGIKAHKYNYLFYGLSALLVICIIALPSHPAVWSYLSKINLVLILLLAFYTVRLFWYGDTPATQSEHYLRIGFAILLFCVIWDILATVYIHSLPRLTPLGFLAFVGSSVLQIARSIIALFSDMVANEKQTRLVEKRKTHSIYNMSREFEKHLHKLYDITAKLSQAKLKQVPKKDQGAIQSSMVGLEALMNDCEQLRKLESGIYIRKHAAIDVRELCKNTIQKALIATEQNKSRLKLKIDRKISMIMSDADILSLAFFHLLKNALVYTEGKVECNVEQVEKDEIKFEFIDEGPGIDTSKAKQVFQKFSRAVENHSKINGLGIGLALVSLVAKNLDGKIEFNNNHGFFSAFVLYVPTD